MRKPPQVSIQAIAFSLQDEVCVISDEGFDGTSCTVHSPVAYMESFTSF